MFRVVLAVCLVALAGPAASEARIKAFRSPSGSITRVMSTDAAGFAQCELRSMPRRGGFTIPRRGRVRRYDVAAEDDLAGLRFTLRYGRTTRLRVFSCTSRFRGMRCRNRATRHGFFISRQRQRVF